LCRAGSQRTITRWSRASAAARRASTVVTTTGSISGVSPTATATANGSVSRPRPRTAALVTSTSGGMTSMKRTRIHAMPLTARSKADSRRPVRGPRAPWARASRVCGPVAVTTAVPLPEATLLPWKHRCGRSAPAASGSAGGSCAGALATSADSPVSTS
jgi:hypothetical protein